MNSTGHSEYNIPAYVHLFMRKQITTRLKRKWVFLGLPSEFYSFASIMCFSMQIIIFVTNKLVCQEQIHVFCFSPARSRKNMRFLSETTSSTSITYI